MAHAEIEDSDWKVAGRARLSREDFLDAWPYVPEFQHLWLYVGFLPLGALIATFCSPVPPAEMWRGQWPLLLLGIPLCAGWAWWNRHVWAESSVQRVGPREVGFVFDEDGLHVRHSSGHHHYEWAELPRPIETKRSLLLYISPKLIVLLPQRAFSADDWAEVVSLLRDQPERRSPPKGYARIVLIWIAVCAAVLSLFELLR